MVEDEQKTPTELTRNVLAGSMKDIESFLEFTFETCEDFENGWLPTLDTCLRVEDNNNTVSYNYFEKDTCNKMTIQLRSAMNENQKIQILSQDMVRRLFNVREELGAKNRGEVVDKYAKKLLQSGYNKEQTRKMIMNGIKGFERKRKMRGEQLRRTAKKSSKSRHVKKLLSKTTWYKKKSSPDNNSRGKGGGAAVKNKEQEQEPQSVLFVEYSRNGELASRMRELMKRLAKVIGFSVKVVERAGTALKNLFPTTTLWDGNQCGREECTTCYQGAEKLPNCRKASLVYENVCKRCNPGADSKKELVDVKSDIPTLYVGETSRSVFERSKEHWKAWRSQKEDSHMLRHQVAEHGGEGDPQFTMRVVKYYKTALSRQVGEAVRIRRRGGAGCILNSKSEYNRCMIPRLIVEEQDEEQIEKKEQEELRAALDMLEACERAWEQQKTEERILELREARNRLARIEKKTNSSKREQPEWGAATNTRKKKLKYAKMDMNWGEEPPSENAPPSSPTDVSPPPLMSSQLPLTSLGSKEKPGKLPGTQQSILRFLGEQQPAELAGSTMVAVEKPDLMLQKTPSVEVDRKHRGVIDDYQGREERTENKENTQRADIIGSIENIDIEREQETLPSVSQNNVPCEMRKDGYCVTHQIENNRKFYVTSKKWKDRGKGRGFGWVSSKILKFQCSVRTSTQNIGNIHQESRNLDNKPGCMMNNLTGLVGQTSQQQGDIILEHSEDK